MCGRYNFSAEEAAEIREIIREVERRLHAQVKTGEIYPTNVVPVLVAESGETVPRAMVWGFPHFKGSGVIINARSETVLEKKMFRDSVVSRRCLVPSTGFFEWKKESDGSKTKLLFRQPGSSVLYMAGLWQSFKGKEGQEERFVILTTAANESMRDTGELSLFPTEQGRMIHERMPVVLQPEERAAWLADSVDLDKVFHREHVLLEHRAA